MQTDAHNKSLVVHATTSMYNSKQIKTAEAISHETLMFGKVKAILRTTNEHYMLSIPLSTYPSFYDRTDPAIKVATMQQLSRVKSTLVENSK